MFGNLIYFNRNKIEQYATLMQGKNQDVILGATVDKTEVSNYLLICSRFEELLKGRMIILILLILIKKSISKMLKYLL